MDIASELRTAGLPVISGRSGIGMTFGVTCIETRITESAKAREGADDVNGVVSVEQAVAYVERSGRVWLLADGPIIPSTVAVVYVAAYRDSDVTEAQSEAVDVLLAVLGAAYGLDAQATAPDTGEIEIEADEADETGDSE